MDGRTNPLMDGKVVEALILSLSLSPPLVSVCIHVYRFCENLEYGIEILAFSGILGTELEN